MNKEQEEVNQVVKAYLKHALAVNEDTEFFWAWEHVTDLVLTKPELAWPIITSLIHESPNDQILANIGAGPLEDLLVSHGADFIERIESEVQCDEKFRRCLAAVWGWHSMPEEIRERITNATRDIPPY